MRNRLTITLKSSILDKLDSIIDGVKIRNRSHAIEYLLNKAFYSDQITAVILAGGEGERMRPLTYELPKSMLPVKKRPLMAYLVSLLKNANIKELLVCTNKQAEAIREYFGNGSRFGVNVTYVFEKQNLGPGGALLKARHQIKSSPFLVLHSDLYTEIDLRELISFHQQAGAMVTIGLKPVGQTRQFGQIALKGSTVTHFFQNPQSGKSNLINSGIYVCNQEVFNYFPPKKEPFDFDDVLVALVKQKQVNGYVFDSLWYDVGTPADYEKVIKIARGS